MSFIQNAQEVLPEQITLIREIMSKVSTGDNTVEELIQLTEFQKTVAAEVANRDRAKNLAFLNGKVYSVEDILKASGYTFKDVTDQFSNITDLLANAGYNKEQQEEHFKKLFKKTAVAPVAYYGTVGSYKVGTDNFDIIFKADENVKKDAKESFKKLNVKQVVEGFSDEFKEFVSKATELKKGDKKGELRYPQVALFAKRMGVEFAALLKEMGLKEGMPEAPKAEAPAKKPKAA